MDWTTGRLLRLHVSALPTLINLCNIPSRKRHILCRFCSALGLHPQQNMLDTLTIISRAGLVLYHQDLQASRLVAGSDDTNGEMSAQSLELINTFLSTALLDHNRYAKLRRGMRTTVAASSSTGGPTSVVEWEEMSNILPSSAAAADVPNADIKRDWLAIATYPEVLAGGAS